MKAVRIHEYGGPEVLVYEEVPMPEPKADQVLVRVAAATVNPIDVAVREDRFPTPKQPPKTSAPTAPAWSSRSATASRRSSPATGCSSAGWASAARAATRSTPSSTRPRPCPRRRDSRCRGGRARHGLPDRLLRSGAARRTCRPASRARPGRRRRRRLGRGADRRRPRRPCRRDRGRAPTRRSSSAAWAPTTSSTTRPRTSSPAAWNHRGQGLRPRPRARDQRQPARTTCDSSPRADGSSARARGP